MKRCPQCGRAYSEIITSCSVCKISLNGGSAPKPVPPVNPPKPPVYNPPKQGAQPGWPSKQSAGHNPPNVPPKKGRMLGVGKIMIALVSLFFVFTILAPKERDSSDTGRTSYNKPQSTPTEGYEITLSDPEPSHSETVAAKAAADTYANYGVWATIDGEEYHFIQYSVTPSGLASFMDVDKDDAIPGFRFNFDAELLGTWTSFHKKAGESLPVDSKFYFAYVRDEIEPGRDLWSRAAEDEFVVTITNHSDQACTGTIEGTFGSGRHSIVASFVMSFDKSVIKVEENPAYRIFCSMYGPGTADITISEPISPTPLPSPAGKTTNCGSCGGTRRCQHCTNGYNPCSGLSCSNGRCTVCGGTGKIRSLDGTKKADCYSCDHGRCTVCNGKGKIKCSICNGYGVCQTCKNR